MFRRLEKNHLHNSLSTPLRVPGDAATLQLTTKTLHTTSDKVRTLLEILENLCFQATCETYKV